MISDDLVWFYLLCLFDTTLPTMELSLDMIYMKIYRMFNLIHDSQYSLLANARYLFM